MKLSYRRRCSPTVRAKPGPNVPITGEVRRYVGDRSGVEVELRTYASGHVFLWIADVVLVASRAEAVDLLGSGVLHRVH